MNSFFNLFIPNASVKNRSLSFVIVGWIVFMSLWWFMLPPSIFPSPKEVIDALALLWTPEGGGLGGEFLSSISISLQSILFASVISLGLTYLSTMVMFKPPVMFLATLRFLSLSGLILFFYLNTSDGHVLKIAVLTFSVSVFLTTDMLQIVDDIPPARFDYARTLGMNHWQILWEVTIRGTLAQAFESIRMNAAMAWMMLTSVEILSRSDGGVGVMLSNLDRHFGNAMPAIVGIQLCILVVGLGQDALLKFLKFYCCPYTHKDKNHG